MNRTKAFKLDQNISCVLLKDDIIFQAKSNASMQRDSDESRSWKEKNEVLHLTKNTSKTISIMQLFYLRNKDFHAVEHR